MNLYHLRYFVKLAEMEHYTKAAEALSITQPSLSHAIDSLEKELGANLFEKAGRNVSLTKYGKSFLEYVENSLKILDSGTEMIKSVTNPESGKIDLGFLRALGIGFIPKLARGFLDTNPNKDIQFTFNTGITSDIL